MFQDRVRYPQSSARPTYRYQRLRATRATLAPGIPFVKVHLSNVHARGTNSRQHSVFPRPGGGVIRGLGSEGYCWRSDTC
ncbi:MAG: type II 3-dehydroquinate dehydratase, partial [Candidatus Accumulibacter sp.]|nr:type II 3-dehydroquinate dehydratase [Candidatus Accumulibacter proximus]